MKHTSIVRHLPVLTLGLAGSFVLAGISSSQAQTAYGFDGTNTLFSFSVTNPAVTTVVGSVGGIGFAPEGIDFNPANGLLYAFNVGTTTGELYTLSLTTGAATLVNTFALSGADLVATGDQSYDITSNTNFGFDFNPKTLQGDGTIRIRLVSEDGDNIRLTTASGATAVAAQDTRLNGTTTLAVGAGYTNNFAQLASVGGATSLYYVNPSTDQLVFSSSPNDGTTSTATSLGVNAQPVTGFDVFTAANGTTNTGYLLTDADSNGISELYSIANPGVSAAVLVGNTGVLNLRDIAVAPVPEPATAAFVTMGLAGLLARRRRVG